MGLGDLIERKSAIDVRLNPALVDSAHELLRPLGNFFAFAPHVTEVQAEDALVAIHQSQRMKLRRLHQSFHCPDLPADSRSRRRGHAENSHSSRRPQSAIGLLPTRAAQWLEGQFNSTPLLQLQEPGQHVSTATTQAGAEPT